MGTATKASPGFLGRRHVTAAMVALPAQADTRWTRRAMELAQALPTPQVYYQAQQTKQFWTSKEELAERLKTSDHLTKQQSVQLLDLCWEFRDIIAKNESALAVTNVTAHHIPVTDKTPRQTGNYKRPESDHQFIHQETQRMLDAGIIQHSTSPWVSQAVIVKKANGKLRFCVDYRRLNQVTVKDAYPLPRIDDLLESLNRACFYTSLDLQSGFWQVPMAPEDRHKTAFATRDGHFEFLVMPFGLRNAPATFQRLMNAVLRDLRSKCAKVYLDDVNVHSKSWEQHLADLREVFLRLRTANLRLNIEKCNFAQPRLVFLGFVVSQKGIEADPQKVQKMLAFQRPTTVQEVRSFLGLIGFYRRFIKDFSKVAKPLTQLLSATPKGQSVKWGQREQKAYETLRYKLVQAPILAYPNLQKKFILHTDASLLGLGAVLSQEDDDDKPRAIEYASRTLNKHEVRYGATELECLGMWWAIKHFHHYLYGAEFDLVTDHHALVYLHKQGFTNRKFSRWITDLQEYTFRIQYQKGKDNPADFLSRPPIKKVG